MSAQTSYPINQGVAYAGQVYALAPADIISKDVETPAGIPFGVAAGRGTSDKQCVLGGADLLGITIRELTREGAANTNVTQYDEKETAGIIRDGYVWAICPSGCTQGDPVKYTIADGVLDAGAAGAGENALDDATWETTTVAGELGIIRINSTKVTAGA